jgi:hypothetical protein
MAYTKTTWVDEVLQSGERFEILKNTGEAVDAFGDFAQCQIQLQTPVTLAGTPIDADNLNNIEDGVEAISTGAALSVKGVAGNAAGDVDDIVAANDGDVLVRNGASLEFGKVQNAGLADHSTPIYLKLFWADEDIALGDGILHFTVPPYLDGATLVDFDIAVYTPSSSGAVEVKLYNLSTSQFVLSTPATIDATEYNSMTATTPPVINPSYEDLVAGHRWRLDVTGIGTGTKGLDVFMEVARA